MPPAPLPERLRFHGSVAWLGTSSGVRLAVGSWVESPFGAFDDVMLAEPDGTRRLLAPSPEIAELVGDTGSFDDIAVVPVGIRRDWSFVRVVAGELDMRYLVGRRTPLGLALHAVPARVATAPWWARGSGATDRRVITRVMGSWRGVELGSLAPVSPDPGFGLGSAPERPCLTTLVTTVRSPH